MIDKALDEPDSLAVSISVLEEKNQLPEGHGIQPGTQKLKNVIEPIEKHRRYQTLNLKKKKNNGRIQDNKER